MYIKEDKKWWHRNRENDALSDFRLLIYVVDISLVKSLDFLCYKVLQISVETVFKRLKQKAWPLIAAKTLKTESNKTITLDNAGNSAKISFNQMISSKSNIMRFWMREV